MSSRSQVYLLAFMFFALGIGLTLYKNQSLGFPLLPGQSEEVWTVESKVTFEGTGDPITVSMILPQAGSNMTVLAESFSAPKYGFRVKEENGQRRAIWTKRESTGSQTIYYKLDVVKNDSPTDLAPPSQQTPNSVTLTAEQEARAKDFLAKIKATSADNLSFSLELVKQLKASKESSKRSVSSEFKNKSVTELALIFLNMEGIPSRAVRGVSLDDGRRKQKAIDLIEIYDDTQWTIINPKTGQEGTPDDVFIWQRGGVSLLDVEGGVKSKVRFATIENDQPAKNVALDKSDVAQSAFIDFSIYSLPTESQSAFKRILLVPIGALVVVLLRIIIGIKTSGTFMPILIALAFIDTTPLAGLAIFLSIVSVGLWIRGYLSRMNLLLVARISAVVIIVIGLMGFMSVISYKLGMTQALTVTFFPMIILAWTIERMSIIWEEDGPKEVMMQGGGSLFVALLAYFAMTNPVIEHITFNFPEMLLVILSITLVVGQYNGYRLTELYRFRDLAKGQKG